MQFAVEKLHNVQLETKEALWTKDEIIKNLEGILEIKIEELKARDEQIDWLHNTVEELKRRVTMLET